ncbi:helix-turn-helix transcriptional regulator [Candidatus Nitrospira bockiana]
MARAERLMELADRLRACAETTVGALAAELGVSSRTVLRDLAALRQRGLPIVGDAGPGGGIRLDGSRGVTAVHMSVTEVTAIWLAARLSREGSDLPWSRAASSGLAKLLSSLPGHRAGALRELCRRVIVGPPAGAEIRSSAGRPPRELLDVFEEGFTNGIGLRFRYTDRFGNKSVRRIEPHGLLVETPVWYILARDVDKQEPRTFRMDRITHPTLAPQIRFTPDLRLIQAQVPEPEKRRPLVE